MPRHRTLVQLLRARLPPLKVPPQLLVLNNSHMSKRMLTTYNRHKEPPLQLKQLALLAPLYQNQPPLLPLRQWQRELCQAWQRQQCQQWRHLQHQCQQPPPPLLKHPTSISPR